MIDDVTEDDAPLDDEPKPSEAAELVAGLAEGPVMLAADRIAGDLLDGLLTEVKTLEQPWQMMVEKKQTEVVDRLRRQVETAVRSACEQIAVRDFPHVEMRLSRVALAKAAAATLLCDIDADNLEILANNVGERVMLVEANADYFMDGLTDRRTTDDQAELDV